MANKHDSIRKTIVYKNDIVFEKSNGGFDIFKNAGQFEYENNFKKDLLFCSKISHESCIGIYGEFLFIDSSTAPGWGGLEIINLKTGKSIYQGIWNGKKISFIDSETIIVLNKFISQKPNDKKGNTFTYSFPQFSFNLNTLTLKNLKKTEEIIGN